MLKPGHYKTFAGSEMWIYGEHGGKSRVAFDWFEEENACCDCQPEPYDEDGYLVWTCGECGGGSAKLFEVKNG